MEIPDLKDIPSVLRRYSSLVWPVVIALVAVAILALTPLLMGSGFKEKISTESLLLGRRVSSLSSSAVARRQSEEEAKYQRAYGNDANQISLLAERTGQRDLLSYKLFPKPKDKSALIFEEFGRQFRDSIEALGLRMNAIDCPTEAELQKTVPGYKSASSGSGMYESIYGSTDSDKSGQVAETIKNVLCKGKAESGSVYANPTQLSGYEFWEEYDFENWDEAIKDCWYWQLGYWVIEDIATTIEAMNSGSSSVLTSPAKRLMSVDFTAKSGQPGKSDEDRPRYVRLIEDAITSPCTGRLCNDDIDVMHFCISVILSTDGVLPFMKELCSAKEHKFRGFFGEAAEQTFRHNQITILESYISPVDREGQSHGLHRYGDDAVVELELVCEYIFRKNCYEQIKPELIKEEAVKEFEE